MAELRVWPHGGEAPGGAVVQENICLLDTACPRLLSRPAGSLPSGPACSARCVPLATSAWSSS